MEYNSRKRGFLVFLLIIFSVSILNHFSTSNTVRFQTFFPLSDSYLSDEHRKFGEELSVVLGKKVRMFGRVALGGTARDMCKQVADGYVDIIMNVAAYCNNEFKDINVMEEHYAERRDEFQEYLQTNAIVSDNKNIEVLSSYVFSGASLFCVSEVESLEDIKGKTVRVLSRAGQNIIEKSGGIPVFRDYNEIMPSILRGTLSCLSTSVSAIRDLRAKKYVPYVIEKRDFLGAVTSLMANKKFIQGNDREAILKSAKKSIARIEYVDRKCVLMDFRVLYDSDQLSSEEARFYAYC